MSELSPEQAVAMLEQAESLVESGEFDPDNFTPDFMAGDDVVGETGDNAETPPATPTDTPPQDSPQTQATPKELDYVQLLAEERAERLALEQKLAQLQALQNEPPKAEPTQEQAGEIDPDELFGDFDGKGLMNGISHIVNQRVEKLLAEKLSHIEQKHAQDMQNEHLNAIHAVHPDAETVVNSDAFAKWVQSQPSYIQPSIVAVVEQGSASQVNELLTNYKATLAPPPAPKTDDIQDKADEIIKNTTPSVPNSLSEMGGQVVADPMTAVANMSSDKMLDAMSGWTPEQIENFLNRQV